MVKKILIVLAVIILLGAGGFAAYYFLFRPVELQGSVENSRSIRLNIKDDIYYDVLVPNEATLLETDEHTIYKFDLLTIGIQDSEPLDAEYKVQVAGRWVFADSKDHWLAPTAYSFEHNEMYISTYNFEYYLVSWYQLCGTMGLLLLLLEKVLISSTACTSSGRTTTSFTVRSSDVGT